MSRSSLLRNQQKKRKAARRQLARHGGQGQELRQLVNWLLRFPEAARELRSGQTVDIDWLLTRVAMVQLRDAPCEAEEVMRKLRKFCPGLPGTLAAEASYWAARGYLGEASKAANDFLSQWPQHPLASGVRPILEVVETALARLGRAPQQALLWDRIRQAGDRDHEVETHLRQILALWPDDAQAANALALLCFDADREEEARILLAALLEREPNQATALVHMVRFEVLTGRSEAARQWTDRLLKVPAPRPLLDQARALSLLGDDAGVLKLLGPEQLEGADLFHLAAAAQGRLGRWDEAISCWQCALQLDPDFELARTNLENALKVPDQRYAPWALNASYWVPRHVYEVHHKDQGSVLASLIPVWLERGDPQLKASAIKIGGRLATLDERFLELLRQFALGAQAPASLRAAALKQVERAERQVTAA